MMWRIVADGIWGLRGGARALFKMTLSGMMRCSGASGAWQKPISFELMKRSTSWILRVSWFQINRQRRKLRPVWQVHIWKISDQVNRRVIRSDPLVLLKSTLTNLCWRYWNYLEFLWRTSLLLKTVLLAVKSVTPLDAGFLHLWAAHDYPWYLPLGPHCLYGEMKGEPI